MPKKVTGLGKGIDKRQARDIVIKSENTGESVRIQKNVLVRLKTNKDTIYGKNYNLLLPNFTALYRNQSENRLESAKIIFESEISKLAKRNRKKDTHLSRGNSEKILFDYLEEITASIIFSYLAIESLMNALIPDNYLYERSRKDGVKEIYNKDAIEKKISTSEKLIQIIPEVTSIKDIRQVKEWKDFEEIERIRNDLVHLKSKSYAVNGNKSLIIDKLLDLAIFELLENTYKLLTYISLRTKNVSAIPRGVPVAQETITVVNIHNHIKNSLDKKINRIKFDKKLKP